MSLQTKLICSAASAIHAAIITHKPDIEPLDQAIGDGDHYINVLRGTEVIDSMADELSSLAADE
ncbi:MAG: dihydroxyacetone kinase-like protein [Methylophilaceae bacterium]|jgi:dihydroxyacetone kinase-like protein